MAEDVERLLRTIAAETLRVASDQLTLETRFSDLGADSLDLVELGMAVEEAFSLEIDRDDYGSFQTLGQAVRYVVEKRAGEVAASPAQLVPSASVASAAPRAASKPDSQPAPRVRPRAKYDAPIVITGMGALSPLGLDVSSTWSRLMSGQGALGLASHLPETVPVRLAAMVPGFDPKAALGGREAHRHGRFAQLAVAAGQEAYRDAELKSAGLAPEELAVIVGVGMGGLEVFESGMRTLLSEGPRRVSPFSVPGLLPNMAAALVARQLGARGPSFGVSSACASAGHALGQAMDLLRSGRARVVIAGGAEACVTEVALVSFDRMAALAHDHAQPNRALRPFDRTRSGFVIGEGAALFVLETREHAQARGATIHAVLAGFGASTDAFHDTQPDPEGRGAHAAMRAALSDAQLAPEQIGYINAHGTGTQLGDRVETIAIRRSFGAHAERVSVSSTKGATGHLLGAAGALEALFCVLALRDQRVPPTLHLDTPDPECDLDYVPHVARALSFDAALSNTFGFGGQNACLVFRKV